jgi:hypothetical protein
MQACVWCAVRDSQQTLDIFGHIDGLLMVIYKETQGTTSDVLHALSLSIGTSCLFRQVDYEHTMVLNTF